MKKLVMHSQLVFSLSVRFEDLKWQEKLEKWLSSKTWKNYYTFILQTSLKTQNEAYIYIIKCALRDYIFLWNIYKVKAQNYICLRNFYFWEKTESSLESVSSSSFKQNICTPL